LHIPDGYLSVQVAAGGFAVSGLSVGLALHRLRAELEERLVPLVGMMTAFIFAAQMLNFPVAAGTSGHFMGASLAVIVLGPAAGLLAMTLVLGLQCFLFADGGVTALGANVFNMGVVGCVVTMFVMSAARRLLGESRVRLLAAGSAAAFLSIVLASAACAVELALSGTAALKVALPAMVGVHAIIGVGEAAITAAALELLMSARPDLIAAWQGQGTASSAPDGLERVAEQTGFAQAERETPLAGASPLADYSVPGVRAEATSTALAGALGTVMAFLVGIAATVALRALWRKRVPGVERQRVRG